MLHFAAVVTWFVEETSWNYQQLGCIKQ